MERLADTAGATEDAGSAMQGDRDSGADGREPAISAEKTARNARMLDRLACMGMDFAEALHKETFGQDDPQADAEPRTEADKRSLREAGAIFSRVANGVRLILALDARLDTQAWARENGVGRTAQSRRAPVKNARKDLLKKIVEKSIQEHAEPRAVYGLAIQLRDKLDDPAIEERLASTDRMADVATDICQDLGIKTHFRPFTDAELDYNIEVDRSFWPDLPKLPKGMVGMPGIPSAYEIQEKAAGRPWPPNMGTGPP